MNLETIDLSRIAKLRLISGVGNGESTACIMSATALLAGLDFNDHPSCTCPVIGRLMVHINDGTGYWEDDAERTATLLPLAPGLLGTKGSADLEKRRRLAVAEWCVRVPAARALAHAARACTIRGFATHAQKLEEASKRCETTA